MPAEGTGVEAPDREEDHESCAGNEASRGFRETGLGVESFEQPVERPRLLLLLFHAKPFAQAR
jgi:hypothetical protein